MCCLHNQCIPYTLQCMAAERSDPLSSMCTCRYNYRDGKYKPDAADGKQSEPSLLVSQIASCEITIILGMTLYISTVCYTRPYFRTKSAAGMCGLENFNNKSFYNAILQCLCNTSPLTNHIKSGMNLTFMMTLSLIR